MNKTALITGITGQDGSHLAELLLEKEYKVVGIVRRTSTDNLWRLKKILPQLTLVYGDMSDQSSLMLAIEAFKPDEVYNLAAMSYVGASWTNAEYTMNINATGLIHLLEAVRQMGKPDTKVYQASTSEMFGHVLETPQTERTKFNPRSIYGVSKCAAYWIARNYCDSYGMFISNGICFNHESYRRGAEFLSRKVSLGVAKIHLGQAKTISLGNLDAKRDWGYAVEYVEAMWKMLQLNFSCDLVISTGETHTIREFVQEAFECIGVKDWEKYVIIDDKFRRPAEVDLLCGDSSLAKTTIGWEPKVKFKELIKIMVESDIERLSRGDKIE